MDFASRPRKDAQEPRRAPRQPFAWGAAPPRFRPPGRFRPFELTRNPQPRCRRKSKFLSLIVSFRNLLVHGYSGVDDRAVRETAARSLPGLLTELDRLLSEQGSDPVRGALSLLGSIRQAPAACPDTT